MHPLLTDADLSSSQEENFPLTGFKKKSFNMQIIWSGADATDATVSIESSSNQSDWTKMKIEGEENIPIDSASGNHVVTANGYVSEFTRVTVAPGTNTTGTISVNVTIINDLDAQ